MKLQTLSLVTVLTLGAACAPTGGGVPGQRARPNVSTRPSRSQDVLSGVEILDRAPNASSAYQAIQRLRNTWLRPLGTRSFQGATPIRIYVDNTPIMAAPASGLEFLDANGLDALNSYPIDRIFEIRYFNARDATQRWGTGHSGGAIELITGTPGGTPDRPEPTPDPNQTFGPFVPFTPGFTYFVNSGAAAVTAPDEVSQVWEPNVNYGAGLGLQATRNITLFAAVEVNRFQFSQSGTLNYFTSREQGRLQSTDGVEVVGEPSTILNLSANLKVHPENGTVRPYLLGGIGYSRFTAGAFRLSGPDGTPLPRSQFGPQIANGGDQIENGVSVAGGVGLEFAPPGRFRLFLDGRYVTAIRGPRYNDAYNRQQLFNTRYYPVRIGLSYH